MITTCLVLASMVALALWPSRGLLIGRVRALGGKTLPRYPIVLAHGLLGFDELEIVGYRHAYFRGIVEHLRKQGLEVFVARVNPSSPISERAAQLAEQVRGFTRRRVNIIAHSMGGLDARYAISKLGLDAQVASLITIGTPHRGTPLADHGVAWLGDRLKIRTLFRVLNVPFGAFDNLTTTHLSAFNLDVLDRKHIYYGSVVASARQLDRTHPVLVPLTKLLEPFCGENDGLVPVSSQSWGHVVLRVDACHFAQIGWLTGYDPSAIFEPLIRELSRRGC